MATWQCIKGCGACCYLDPSERPDLDLYLTPEELQEYLSLVGADGWCIHYRAGERTCSIYANRPRFCRVSPDVFADLYEIEADELNDFAIACCQEHIDDVYGELSLERLRYDREIGSLA
jgi:uncharacterized protein